MKHKKIWAISLIAALSTGMLAGCQKETKEKDNVTSEKASEDETTVD